MCSVVLEAVQRQGAPGRTTLEGDVWAAAEMALAAGAAAITAAQQQVFQVRTHQKIGYE